LAYIESAVPLDEVYDRIQLFIDKDGIICHDSQTYHGLCFAVVGRYLGDGKIEPGFNPAGKTFDYPSFVLE
jgi:hypothetical protein